MPEREEPMMEHSEGERERKIEITEKMLTATCFALDLISFEFEGSLQNE